MRTTILLANAIILLVTSFETTLKIRSNLPFTLCNKIKHKLLLNTIVSGREIKECHW